MDDAQELSEPLDFKVVFVVEHRGVEDVFEFIEAHDLQSVFLNEVVVALLAQRNVAVRAVADPLIVQQGDQLEELRLSELACEALGALVFDLVY